LVKLRHLIYTMANITKYLEKKLLEHSIGKTEFTVPSVTYAALFTSSPTADYTPTTQGPAVEVSGTGYVRVEVTNKWNTAVDNNDLTNSSKITNSDDLRWPAAGTISASWGLVTTIGIFDAASAGNLLWFGPLSVPVTLGSGDSFTIPEDSLTLTLT